MRATVPILTCEHAGNEVPELYHPLFENFTGLLNSHLALDVGSLSIAERINERLNCPFFSTRISRLLVDCNRSLTNPNCFSQVTKHLSKKDKNTIIQNYYSPFRHQVEEAINQAVSEGKQVLHISIHTFTPNLGETPRNAALGLLYNSARHAEREVVRVWHSLLETQKYNYNVRLNYPYRGDGDSFPQSLRKKYSQPEYLGIELFCNQILLQEEHLISEISTLIYDSLVELLQFLND